MSQEMKLKRRLDCKSKCKKRKGVRVEERERGTKRY